MVSARKKSGCHHAGDKCRVTGEEPNRNQQVQNQFYEIKSETLVLADRMPYRRRFLRCGGIKLGDERFRLH